MKHVDDAQAEEEAGAQYERLWDAVWVRAQDIIAEVTHVALPSPAAHSLSPPSAFASGSSLAVSI